VENDLAFCRVVILNVVKSLPCKGSLYLTKAATLYTITESAIEIFGGLIHRRFDSDGTKQQGSYSGGAKDGAARAFAFGDPDDAWQQHERDEGDHSEFFDFEIHGEAPLLG